MNLQNMKRITAIHLITVFFLSSPLSIVNAQTPQKATDIASLMVPGWNLGNTLEAGPCTWLSNDLDWETGWQPTRTTQKIINYVRDMGFRSVRIPCSWDMHMTSKHKIKTAWMRRVKQVVDYCMNADLYVMLNDHWDNGWIEVDGFKDLTEEKIQQKCELQADMWTQIATEFADYDHRLLFASMNEPNAEDDAITSGALKRYHQAFVDAVRATGGRNAERVLVVQAPSTNIDYGCTVNVLPEDPTPDRLMFEVHFYGPYNFVMMTEDADWGYMAYYWGKNNHLAGSNHNATWGEEAWVQQELRKMRTKYTSKGIPVIIGEYGAIYRTMPEGESQEKHDASYRDWYKAVTRYAINNGCVPMVWDTNGSNSVINRTNCTIGCQFSYNGIMEGLEAGKWPFTTDIDEIGNGQIVNSKCYNLMGQPVSDSYKGIVIMNGKKVVR